MLFYHSVRSLVLWGFIPIVTPDASRWPVPGFFTLLMHGTRSLSADFRHYFCYKGMRLLLRVSPHLPGLLCTHLDCEGRGLIAPSVSFFLRKKPAGISSGFFPKTSGVKEGVTWKYIYLTFPCNAFMEPYCKDLWPAFSNMTSKKKNTTIGINPACNSRLPPEYSCQRGLFFPQAAPEWLAGS